MSVRSLVFRLAAVVLLLMTAADVFACELISPASCEISGTHSDDGGPGCLCCCRHVVVAAPLVFTPTEEALTVYPSPEIQPANFEPGSIYHPPRV